LRNAKIFVDVHTHVDLLFYGIHCLDFEHFVDHVLFLDRPRAVSSESPRSPVGTPVNSIGELVPPGTSPVALKSPDVDVSMPQFPANRRESNEMSLEEEQLAGVRKGLLKLLLSCF